MAFGGWKPSEGKGKMKGRALALTWGPRPVGTGAEAPRSASVRRRPRVDHRLRAVGSHPSATEGRKWKCEIEKSQFDCKDSRLKSLFLNKLETDLDKTQNTRSVVNLYIYNSLINFYIMFYAKIWFKTEFKEQTKVWPTDIVSLEILKVYFRSLSYNKFYTNAVQDFLIYNFLKKGFTR